MARALAGGHAGPGARGRGPAATRPGARVPGRSARRPRRLLGFRDLLERADVVVEAATQAALVELAPVDPGGRAATCVVLSVGALLDHPEWVERAAARGGRIHAPSAAIAGLDGLKGAAVDGHLDTVVMETRKPPRGLAGAPGVAGIDLAAITAPTLVFEGTAREACRAFPANVNVVAAVSLAGLGPDRTCIRIHADPPVDRNRHTVTAEGAFGRLRIEIENVPSENPRTGKLSYLSRSPISGTWAHSLRVGT